MNWLKGFAVMFIMAVFTVLVGIALGHVKQYNTNIIIKYGEEIPVESYRIIRYGNGYYFIKDGFMYQVEDLAYGRIDDGEEN